jgi:hypothetical protein
MCGLEPIQRVHERLRTLRQAETQVDRETSESEAGALVGASLDLRVEPIQSVLPIHVLDGPVLLDVVERARSRRHLVVHVCVLLLISGGGRGEADCRCAG